MSKRLERFIGELRYAPDTGANGLLVDEYERGYRHAEDDIKRELLEIWDRDRKEAS